MTVALILTAAGLVTTLLAFAFAVTGNAVHRGEWTTSETIRRAPELYERDNMRDATYLPAHLAQRLRMEAALSSLATAGLTLVDEKTADDLRALLELPGRPTGAAE